MSYARVLCVGLVGVGLVGAAADVDRTGGRTDGGAAPEHRGEDEAVGPELRRRVHDDSS